MAWQPGKCAGFRHPNKIRSNAVKGKIENPNLCGRGRIAHWCCAPQPRGPPSALALNQERVFDVLDPNVLSAKNDADHIEPEGCLLYTSDAADDLLCVDL